tara:strand:- start:962 stop:1363 length:402 start_codon:yes stop_codon:yes gene_type:complete
MKVHYSSKNNPRVIVIQKIYSKIYNKDDEIIFQKHRFKKFIKDVVLGTLERDEVLQEEIFKSLDDIKFNNMDKILQTIIKSATYEFLYKPKVSKKIIIKEYLNASNFFLDNSKTKYLNALLDKISKEIRKINE